MKKAGIEKALKRLTLASGHLKAIRAATDYEAFEAAWYQFLVVANSIDNVLEFSASKDRKSRPWYGGKIHLRV
ncbi:MAG: hypothetical protein ABIT09_02410 [Croceibacterium sp.]